MPTTKKNLYEYKQLNKLYFARILCWKQIMTILLGFLKVESDKHLIRKPFWQLSHLFTLELHSLKWSIYDFTNSMNLHYIIWD